jgi:hypothetical protein
MLVGGENCRQAGRPHPVTAEGAWFAMPDEAIFRLDRRDGGITIVDLIEGVPIVRLLDAT